VIARHGPDGSEVRTSVTPTSTVLELTTVNSCLTGPTPIPIADADNKRYGGTERAVRKSAIFLNWCSTSPGPSARFSAGYVGAVYEDGSGDLVPLRGGAFLQIVIIAESPAMIRRTTG